MQTLLREVDASVRRMYGFRVRRPVLFRRSDLGAHLCCRLCSLAQHAKQETEDLLTKGSVKPEPPSSERDEGAATEENNLEAKVELGERWSSSVRVSDNPDNPTQRPRSLFIGTFYPLLNFFFYSVF